MEQRAADIWGVVGEFENPEALVRAAERLREEGYRRFEAYSPFSVPGLEGAMGLRRNRVPLLVLAAALCGAATGFGMQVFSAVYHYPLNVGGRPNFSWPAFIPLTFELGVLFAAGAAVMSVIVLNGLPMPYHAVFNTPNFNRASQDRFFLSVHHRDALFDAQRVQELMRHLGAVEVSIVEP